MSLKKSLLYPFAKLFFAGLTLNDALWRAKYLNSRGIGATIDFLGEDVSDGTEARQAKEEYRRAIGAVSAGSLDASLAIKLSHVGMVIDPALAGGLALELAAEARDKHVFLWVDMEGSRYTDGTMEIFRKLREIQPESGIALQAYLKRTPDDLRALTAEGAAVRLVKGAYNEPPEIALQDMRGIRAQYVEMAEYLFANSRSFAVGTHDRILVERVLGLSKGYTGAVEFQMLMGMRDDLKRRLTGLGKRVVEYVPYGSDWYGYGVRRLKEKRRNLLYFAQGLFGR